MDQDDIHILCEYLQAHRLIILWIVLHQKQHLVGYLVKEFVTLKLAT